MKLRLILSCLLIFTCLSANSQITVTSSNNINCTTPTSTLSATLEGDTPTDAGITIDDQYSSLQSLGFLFTYYGTTYAHCLLGANGTICFDTTLAGTYDPWPITSALLGNTSKYSNICGPWCDIDVVYGGTITYSIDGTAPYRKYVVTYCATHMYSCTTQYTTTQMVLYETTNLIDVYVAHKTICAGWNGGYAIIGVENADGSAATVAPGRDYPSRYTCYDEGWRFTPSASGTSYSVASIPFSPVPFAASALYWFDSSTGAFLGTGSSITVSPTTTTTYKVGALGCADTSFSYVTVVSSGFVTDSISFAGSATVTGTRGPSVCMGTDGYITIAGLTPGLVDTLNYMVGGVPQTPIIATVSAAGTMQITGLGAGTYTNIVIAQGSCVTAPLTVTLNPAPLNVSVLSSSNPSYCGANDGSITLTGLYPSTSYVVNYNAGGVPAAPVTITSNYAGNLVIGGLTAYGGSTVYSNISTTGGPCPTDTVGPVTLTNPAPPVVTVDSAEVKTCVGVSTTLHAFASPAGLPYSYVWTPPTDLTSATVSAPVVTPASAGDVFYTVTVNPGPDPTCAATANVQVHTLAPFILNNRDTAICLGNYVQASVTGSAELNYVWSPVTGVSNTHIMNPRISPSVSTEYVLTATYANCPNMVDSFNIEVDTLAPTLNIVDTICLGMTDSFNVAVAGPGTGSNFYTYSWTPASEVSNPSIPDPILNPPVLGSNSFSILVAPHALGCSTTDMVNIYVLPNHISVDPTDTMICQGQIVQVVGSGDPHFSYQWIPTAGIAVSDVLNALITPDTAALYTVTASFHRCPLMTATLNLTVQPTPTVNVGNSRLMCQYDTLHLKASVYPDWYSGYTYLWSPGTNLDVTTSNTVVFSGSTSTTLYVTVTTPAGCSVEDSLSITVFPGNFASMIPDNMGFCPHESATLTPTAPAGTSYHWYPSLYLDDSLGTAPLISPITSQIYTVVATSANGCKDTVHFTSTVYPAGVVEIGADSVTLYPGDSYQLQPKTNCTSYSWFPPEGLSDASIINPLATPTSSTKYVITATTENGCKVSDSISILVDIESLIAAPNAFTPGSGNNNLFKIMKRGLVNVNYFRVYDRWGQLMFETTDINQGWDGNFKGQSQPLGVYVYEVQAVASDGTLFTKHGNVTLIK